VRYPARLISVIDLLSIFALVTSVFHLFEGSDITKALTVFRIIRICRYSKNVRFILEILKKSKKALAAVGALALGYIAVSAIIMFNVEPQSFNTFFDAVYWSTVSLTTVGYGDIYPITVIGRAVAMISSFFGIAVVALPAGIVTAEYLAVLKDEMKDDSN
jgi:voltage-gated potassium channel